MNSKKTSVLLQKNHTHMNNVLLIKLRHKRKLVRYGSRDRRSRRNTKKLFNTAGMGQGKPKLTWINLVWDVKGKRQASAST